MASLILFLTIGGRSGWTLPHVVALGLSAVVILWVFVLVERKAARPILELSLLKDRVLAPTLIVSYLVFISTFINWFILPFYMSDVLNTNAQTWGLVIMLMTVTNAIFAPVGGWLSDRMPPAYTITTAVGISALTMALFTTLGVDSSVSDVAILMVATGVGMGLFQAANANLIMGTFPPDRQRRHYGGGLLGATVGERRHGRRGPGICPGLSGPVRFVCAPGADGYGGVVQLLASGDSMDVSAAAKGVAQGFHRPMTCSLCMRRSMPGSEFAIRLTGIIRRLRSSFRVPIPTTSNPD